MAHNYHAIPLAPTFEVEVLPHARGFKLSDRENLFVENIWKDEMERRAPHLHNGKIFNVVSIEPGKIIGEFIDYKFYLSQLRDPHLADLLSIKILSISGLTTTEDKILMGQRASHVSAYPNAYEFVPSGGVDPEAQIGDLVIIDRCFTKELGEETGISAAEIQSIRLRALIFDKESKLYELCAEIRLFLEKPLQGNGEYQQLRWISKNDIKKFLKTHQEQVIPFSLHLASLGEFKDLFESGHRCHHS
ncbi:MAG: NUDIX hydrolase [Verrucomicrobia bacterium]|nr:NUDIX hydrolase [Verrucomicrobiota bacterium]